MPTPLMVTNWLTIGEAESAVSNVLHTDYDSMRPEDAQRITSNVANALTRAEADILPIMTAKGYSLTALGNWIHRSSILCDQTIFRALVRQDALSNVINADKIKEFDWREALKNEKYLPLGPDGKPIPLDLGLTGPDGVDTDGLNGPDLFGGNRVTVGRLSQRNYRFNIDTKF